MSYPATSFTIPTGGLYLVEFIAQWSPAASGGREVWFQINSTLGAGLMYGDTTVFPGLNGDQGTTTCAYTGTQRFSAGDVVRFGSIQLLSGGTLLLFGSTNSTSFTRASFVRLSA